MQQSVNHRLSRIGMTIDEREDFIILLTIMHDDVLFDCETFADGSVGLRVELGRQSLTVKRPQDWFGEFASALHFNDVYGEIFMDRIEYRRICGIMFPNARPEDFDYHPARYQRISAPLLEDRMAKRPARRP